MHKLIQWAVTTLLVQAHWVVKAFNLQSKDLGSWLLLPCPDFKIFITVPLLDVQQPWKRIVRRSSQQVLLLLFWKRCNLPVRSASQTKRLYKLVFIASLLDGQH